MTSEDWRIAWHRYVAGRLRGVRVPIPLDVDWPELLADLKGTGLFDREIESRCALRTGYVAQLRGRYIKEPIHEKGAALLNLWISRCVLEP